MSGGESAPRRGRQAEKIAAAFLELQGLRILDRNRRAAGGEIDLIAREAGALVFVEVRMRAAGAWVSAVASLDPRKRRRLRSCARALARERALRWPGRTIRFDVVTVESRGDSLRLDHLRQVRI